MTKTEMATKISLETRVYIRRARARGYANLIDADALWSAALRRGYDADG